MEQIYKELDFDIDVDQIKTEIEQILTVTDYFDNQIALQYATEMSWDDGTVKKNHTLNSEEYDYVNWHPFLDGFYIKRLLESLKFPVAHARIMRLPPKTCYTTHVDYYTRWHIPVVSKPLQTYMHFPDKNVTVRMYPGKLYWTNTYELHNFINGTFNERIHIVFNNATERKNLNNPYLAM